MLTSTAATEAALNFDTIKEMMDGFNPEALLPQMDTIFSKVLLVCRVAVMIGPVLLLVLGLAYLFLAPREANYYFGYRCYFGMGSVNAWRFTQRIAGIVLGGLGLILTPVMFFISSGFAGMQVMDMVWKALRCLLWQAGLTILATLALNGLAMFWFNRKGELRRRPQK